jgi:peptidoglycan/LPS O-acetylase OafA/YrhL
LSGFLITSIVLKHGDSPGFLCQFYLRRGLRIWPIYYLTLLGFILFRHHLPDRCDWAGLWYYLTYMQDVPLYWSSEAPRFHGFLGHTWTQAIEEQFYLLWPVAVMLCGASRILPLVLGCLTISMLGRVFGWPASLLLTRLDGLVLGGLVAAILHSGHISRSRASLIFGIIAMLGVAGVVASASSLGVSCSVLSSSGPGLLAVNTAGMGLIGLVVTSAGTVPLTPLRWAPLVHLGKISCGLYLYHYVILRISAGQLRLWASRSMPVGRQVVTLILCFVAAILSWILIEQPILKLKNRFEYGHVSKEPVLAVKASRRRLLWRGIPRFRAFDSRR